MYMAQTLAWCMLHVALRIDMIDDSFVFSAHAQKTILWLSEKDILPVSKNNLFLQAPKPTEGG